MSQRRKFSIRRITSEQVIAQLPTIEDYSSSTKNFHILVVAAGFEQRILESPSRLIRDGISISRQILIGDYTTNASDNEERFSELEPLLDALGSPISRHFDAEDPKEIGRAVASAFFEVPEEEDVDIAFDISGASSTLILSVIAAVLQQQRRTNLTVLYTTASSYDPEPGTKLNEELRLESQNIRERGVSRVNQNELCSGLHHDHLPAVVIALPSMYTERLESCLSHLNVGPMTGSQDNLFWILPSTETPEHCWRQEATRASVEALIERYEGRESDSSDKSLLDSSQVAFCDVSSYQHCLALVVDRADQYQGRNISVVHMGTKLQAIGVALAVAARQEIAVVTARPTGFNAKTYSSGVGSLHQIVFNDIGSVVESIARIGCIEVGV